jgi:hypothetical protein
MKLSDKIRLIQSLYQEVKVMKKKRLIYLWKRINGEETLIKNTVHKKSPAAATTEQK